MIKRLFSSSARFSKTYGNRQANYLVPSVVNISDRSFLQVTSESKFKREALPELQRTRIVPKLATFYSANPIHETNVYELEEVVRKYSNLPTVALVSGKSTRWMNISEYRLIGGGSRLRPVQYSELIEVLNRLDSIDKQLVNPEIEQALAKYRKDLADWTKENQVPELDSLGRAVAVGRRKTSLAKVYLVRGNGEFIVNGRSLAEYFPRVVDRHTVVYPLTVVDSEIKYNVFVKTNGGGPTGQAGAIASGIARCLVIFNRLLKPRLRKAGCMTVDTRQVERKKPGKVKSRKSPTWVKR